MSEKKKSDLCYQRLQLAYERNDEDGIQDQFNEMRMYA